MNKMFGCLVVLLSIGVSSVVAQSSTNVTAKQVNSAKKPCPPQPPY